jgi:hypothetical protein
MTKQKSKDQKHLQERSFWASFWIVIIIIHAIVMAIIETAVLKGPQDVNRPVLIGILAISSLATIIAMYGVWRWKQWGLYCYAITVIVSITVGLILTASQLFVFNRVILPAFLAWSLKDKWAYFD